MADDVDLDPTDRWFAVNLKAARERGSLSQETVAQRMRDRGFPGFRQQTVARIEAGERGVQVGEALALAGATGSGLSDLARPPELTWDAMALRGATLRLLKLRGEAAEAARLEAEATERLTALVAAREGEGKGEALAGELARAREALTTAGDEGPDSPGDDPGTPGSVL